jgi:hypothetical protein
MGMTYRGAGMTEKRRRGRRRDCRALINQDNDRKEKTGLMNQAPRLGKIK